MLELMIEGDTHPKTVKLKTDDADGELGIIQNSLAQADVKEGETFRKWFDDATNEQFEEGVTIPAEVVGEWGDVWESCADETPDFEKARLTMEQLREDGAEQMGKTEQREGAETR